MLFIRKLLNLWIDYPKHKPNKRGWYECSVYYGYEVGQSYVMDLFWDDKNERWCDNRRLNVYQNYKVFGYNKDTGNEDKRMSFDSLCYRDDVVAFKRMSKLYNRRKI